MTLQNNSGQSHMLTIFCNNKKVNLFGILDEILKYKNTILKVLECAFSPLFWLLKTP